MGSEAASPTLGIYIHWPYCQSKCPYCDFNAYASADFDHRAWLAAYLRQLDSYFEETSDRTCASVYFGGGTPSLMDPRTVDGILDRIDSAWGFEDGHEVTLEANPSSSDAERFGSFRAAGVNRISIGVQSLRDDDLRRLGRLHSAAEARSAFDAASTAFERTSIDLIYGRQHQSLDGWTNELEEALDWGSEHLSLYQLTVEPGTSFGARQRAGRLSGLPDDELAADMFIATQEICERSGRAQYEISNFACPGSESRHNLLYWRYLDFLGVGPGAHGRFAANGRMAATETHLSPETWLSAVAERGTGESMRTLISDSEQAEEYLLMSLRLAEGVDARRYALLNGAELDGEAIKRLEAEKLVEISEGRLRATAKGRLVLNAILAELACPKHSALT